jgi:hypothetical protein
MPLTSVVENIAVQLAPEQYSGTDFAALIQVALRSGATAAVGAPEYHGILRRSYGEADDQQAELPTTDLQHREPSRCSVGPQRLAQPAERPARPRPEPGQPAGRESKDAVTRRVLQQHHNISP